MSYPTFYDITYSYSGFSAGLGDGAFPGTQLDADMAGLSDSVASINAFIQVAFRSDGVLKAASLPGTDPILQYVDEAAAEATKIASAAATSASASATAAAGSASSAATSETQAATSASAAQTARTGAETAASAAAASAALTATFDPNMFYPRTALDAKFDAVDADFATVDEKLSAKASKRNRHLNPAFQICQDRTTGATIAISSGGYVLDGVDVYSSGGGVLTCSQVAKATPGGSPYRFRAAVTTADATIAAGDVYDVEFKIEGTDVADLMLGTPSAKSCVWRGVVNLPAGTYGLSFGNATGTRSYVTTFSISAGQAATDVLVSAVVPGDTSGTWLRDASGAGLIVRICLAAGATFRTATTGAWQAGNYLTTSSQTNAMATTATVAEIADIGLYAGSELPAWEMPSYADDLCKCQRYWYSIPHVIRMFPPADNTTFREVPVYFPSSMRVTPAISGSVSAGSSSGPLAVVKDYVVFEAADVGTGTFCDLTTLIANARL